MINSLGYQVRAASVLAIVTTMSSWASGQEPVRANSAPAPTGAPGAVAYAPTAGDMSSEPTHDTATTHSSLPNRPLLVTGLVLFGGSYGASVIVGAISDRDADKKLYYPLAGPWMDMYQRDCDTKQCDHEVRNNVLFIADGAVQGLGALSLLLSVMIPEKTTAHWSLIGSEDVIVLPRVSSSSLGLGAIGRF